MYNEYVYGVLGAMGVFALVLGFVSWLTREQ